MFCDWGRGGLDSGQRLGAWVRRSQVILGHTSTTCTKRGVQGWGIGLGLGSGTYQSAGLGCGVRD